MYLLFVCALLAALLMNSSLVEATHDLGEVLFDSSNIMNYEMPESCQGKSYCFEKGDNYPEELIEELLKDIRELVDQNVASRPSIGSRNGDIYDEPDCPYNSTDSPIYYITDTAGIVRVVVQSPKKFQQIYSLKWCSDEGRITEDTPHFLKTTTLKKFQIECVSTRMNFDFFVLSDDVTNLKMEIASPKDGIPVCCKCRYSVKN